MSNPPLHPDEFRKTFAKLRDELSRVIVGQGEVIDSLLVAFFAGGHVLLEGVPGLGKTLLAKTFAQALGLSFHRIQCTPDLMPADILGTQLVVDRDGRKAFEFVKGPVFTHILLADEVNRATPKTQSALLEAMEEHQVTIAGTTFRLDEPFFVMATQNPIEMEGSLPLDETVFVNGRLAQGFELLKEARRTNVEVHTTDGKRLYHIPDLWTWTLNPYGMFERQPCELYVLPYRGTLFRVRTRTGRQIRVTAEHPFLVNQQGEVHWKLARDLRVGDYLVTPTSIPQPEARTELMSHHEAVRRLATRYTVVRHEELLTIVSRSAWLRRSNRIEAADLDKLRIAAQLTKRQLAQHLRLSRRGYWQLVKYLRRGTQNPPLKRVLIRYFATHQPDLSHVRDFIESYTLTTLKRFPVTPEVIGWLAFLLSDGTVGRWAVAAFQKNYPEALNAFIRTSTETIGTGIDEIRQRPGGREVWIRSKPLVDYLRSRFGITRSGVIPSWMLSLPQECRRTFLRTFISLESHCDEARHRITFVQKRRPAVNVIMHLLLLEGILSSARRRETVYELKIQGEDFQKFFRQIGWIDGRAIPAKSPSSGRTHDYSPFRVVPVNPSHLEQICDLLGIDSFHRARNRRAIATRLWYNAYRFGRVTGIVSEAKLNLLIEDVQREIQLRRCHSVEALVAHEPHRAAMLCGLSLPEVARGVGVSAYAAWKGYIAPRCSPDSAISAYIRQQFQDRLGEVERLTNGLRRLSQMRYDEIESIEKTPYAGPVFGLTVPRYHNYIAGFGACGISHNTYPLPEAQLDRFLFKIFVGYPSPAELSQILQQTTTAQTVAAKPVLSQEQAQGWILNARRLVREVLVARAVEEYVVRLVTATRPSDDGTENPARRLLRYGASPRGAQAILMGAKVFALIDGRVNVSFDDIERVILPALTHRIILSFEAEADRRSAADILTELTQPIRRASDQ